MTAKKMASPNVQNFSEKEIVRFRRVVVPRSSARITPTLKTFGRNIKTGFLGLLKWLEIALKGLMGPVHMNFKPL